ncbi:glycosyltransferase [Paraburkholderia bryophila]|uniref:Glycosyltransferase involved in cell wall biosynthesis n=1 Tax=Paraburkholderia bryophila TaxID=420952 RepID=A0A7Y9WVG4_9BURK|nr:glycosyltransferase [Paraburkholderia bryophila]NYH27178.1 glycosyltransferase involved in cell wall biosynthesis [Paraburkholderia bryophila]
MGGTTPTKVLVINDYVRKGGAEEVYRTSVDVLRTLPGVVTTSFDESSLPGKSSMARRAWNPVAARALAETIERVRPDRVLVHNYHGLMSPAILPVLARYKRQLGFRTFLTCHDYHLVFYNPNLLTYPRGRATALPLSTLASPRRLVARASPRGITHDAIKKLHWHMVNALFNPADVFDLFLCPSTYMREALAQRGLTSSVLLLNPVSTDIVPEQPKPATREQFDLAFVGRVEAEKGLDEFLQLALRAQCHRISSVTVYGDGTQREALQIKYADLIAARRLRFAGRLDHGQLFTALRTHDALVLPSIWAENAPLVIVEAAMIGLPVLTHDIGSLSTFGDEIGNKIKYGPTPASLVSALEMLRQHLGDSRRHYHWSGYTRQHYTESIATLLQLGKAENLDLVAQCS